MQANNKENIIIEGLKRNYTNKSVIKSIDTQFKFFKFPPTITPLDADFNIPDIIADAADFGFDPVSGFHKIPKDNEVSEHYIRFRLSYDTTSSWMNRRTFNGDTMPKKSNGKFAGGVETIPFTQTLDGAQLGGEGNDGFLITPNIIKILREGGKTVRLKFQTVCNVAGKPWYNYSGYPYYNESRRNSVNTGLFVTFERSMPTRYRHNGDTGAAGRSIYKPFDGYSHGDPYTYVKARDWVKQNFGAFYANETAMQEGDVPPIQDYYPVLTLDYIIDPTDLAPYDCYRVRLKAGGPAWFLRDSTYFQVTLIDDPGLDENGNAIGTLKQRRRKYGKQPMNRLLDPTLFPNVAPGTHPGY